MVLLREDRAFNLEERLGIVVACRDGFAREQGLNAAGERELGARFRRQRSALEALLDPARAPERVAPAPAALRTRSQQVRPVARALRARAAEGRLCRRLEEIAARHLHMHANRPLP